MSSRRIVYVHLDSFIASLERQARPDLRGKPLLVGGDPARRGLVVAVSIEAAAYAIAPGMPTWEALRLCPQATLITPHPDLYTNRAQMALSVLDLYSNHVEHSQLDSFFLAIANPSSDILAGLQRQLGEQIGVSVSLGCASNKLVAQIAALLHAPGSLADVPAGQEEAFLAPLPLHWLAPDDKIRARLGQLGLHTIGDLARAPEHLLVAHMGEAGKTLRRHALGKDMRALRSTQHSETIEREQVFEHMINEREALRRWAAYLVAQVGQDLRAHESHARMLTMTLGQLDNAPAVLTVVLPKATNVDHTLRTAALHLLTGWDGRTNIVSLGIEASVINDDPGFQLNLFSSDDNDWEERQHRLDTAHNGINKRYGPGAVMPAMLLDDDILAAMGKRRRKK
jgi:DNA polymerase IV